MEANAKSPEEVRIQTEEECKDSTRHQEPNLDCKTATNAKRHSLKRKASEKVNHGFYLETNKKHEAWKKHYEDLRQFSARHGHCDVPIRFPENPQLGQWVSTQRVQYKHWKEGKPSSMNEERVKALDELEFVWKSTKRTKLKDEAWEKRYKELKRFKECYGHCDVSRAFQGNPQLGQWVSYQRVQYKRWNDGEPSSMNKERVKALDELGFAWEATKKTKVKTKAWEKRCEELRQFKVRYGHCDVPRKFEETPQLGEWVSYQRVQYKRWREDKPSSMNKERVKALDELGFAWEATSRTKLKAEAWEKRYEELKQFKLCHGHSNLPNRFPENQQLANWVHAQRTLYNYLKEGKSSPITEERIKALDELGFVWKPERTKVDDKAWEKRYEELKQYKACHGNCIVPYNYPENQLLANWVGNQRAQYKHWKEGKPSLMTKERIQALDEIDLASSKKRPRN